MGFSIATRVGKIKPLVNETLVKNMNISLICIWMLFINVSGNKAMMAAANFAGNASAAAASAAAAGIWKNFHFCSGNYVSSLKKFNIKFPFNKKNA